MDVYLFVLGSISLSLKCNGQDIYLSENTIQGYQRNLSLVCNGSGLLENPILPNHLCRNLPELAWIKANAFYAPWIEFIGCGTFNTTKVIPNHMNFTNGPNLEECRTFCLESIRPHEYLAIDEYSCRCFYDGDIEFTLTCEPLQMCNSSADFLCGDYNSQNQVVYKLNSTYIPLKDVGGSCGIVEIENNAIEFRSQECWKVENVLCYDKKLAKFIQYPTLLFSWTAAIRHCNAQDQTIALSDHVTNETVQNVTDGIYWISQFREVTYFPFNDTRSDDFSHCVALRIGDTHRSYQTYPCDKYLPVVCMDTTGTNEYTSCTTFIPTDQEDSTNSTRLFTDPKDNLTLILIIAGCCGLVFVVVIIITVVLCTRKKSKKLVNHDQANSNVSTSKSTHENLEYAEVTTTSRSHSLLSDANNENVYDHTDTSKQPAYPPESENYDTMATVREDTEGIYDQSERKENVRKIEDVENVYDHA